MRSGSPQERPIWVPWWTLDWFPEAVGVEILRSAQFTGASEALAARSLQPQLALAVLMPGLRQACTRGARHARGPTTLSGSGLGVGPGQDLWVSVVSISP